MCDPAAAIGTRFATCVVMPSSVVLADAGADPLASALVAAELEAPLDFARFPPSFLRELFQSAPQLSERVPYAAIRLLGRVASACGPEIRIEVARALRYFGGRYRETVEAVLVSLALDGQKKVRTAAAHALAHLLLTSHDPRAVVARWQRLPERARDALAQARALLSSDAP